MFMKEELEKFQKKVWNSQKKKFFEKKSFSAILGPLFCPKMKFFADEFLRSVVGWGRKSNRTS